MEKRAPGGYLHRSEEGRPCEQEEREAGLLPITPESLGASCLPRNLISPSKSSRYRRGDQGLEGRRPTRVTELMKPNREAAPSLPVLA